jgi:phosphoribosylanthranilate isomerase
MFRIKICGVTSIEDARAAADAGADAVGLNFFRKSRRFVEPEIAGQIASTLPAGIAKVGVFVNQDAREILEIVRQAELDSVQLHGDEPATLLAELPKSVRIVRAHRCGAGSLCALSQYLDEAGSAGRMPDALLIDADAGADFGGTGRRANWSLVAKQRSAFAGLPLILAGGLTPDNVAEAIAAVRPDGVDVASGVESKAGVKDRELVTQFINRAREALARL